VSSLYLEFLFLQVENLFQEAARLSPEDSDIHTVLGVLYNLSRNYDKAISSFERALQLKPRDYSLWNKLGATQANSSRSAEAIYAYQEVGFLIRCNLFETYHLKHVFE
jgi:peroxin-5